MIAPARRTELVETYLREGYAELDRAADGAELRALAGACDAWLAHPAAARVLESDGHTVRSVYGVHLRDGPLRELCVAGALPALAREVLGDDVFVYQSKINVKAAFTGGAWAWHQDYIFWYHEDGMRAPGALNVMLYLDDVTPFNGAMFLIPRSQRRGLIEAGAAPKPDAYRDAPDWIGDLTEELKFCVPRADVRALAEAGSLHQATGPAGAMLMFHPNVVHASPANLSPHHRRVLTITYCAHGTPFASVPSARPVYLRGTAESGRCAAPAEAR